MTHLLKRHPLPIKTFLRRSLVLAYSAPAETLEPLLHPGLELDTFEGFGFFVVAMVQSERLRAAFLPRALGTSFFLAGYRLFARYRTLSGKHLRGLQVLGSETDRPLMMRVGNVLTHYAYRLTEAEFAVQGDTLDVVLRREGRVTLDASAQLDEPSLPPGSIFSSLKEARRFEGPMPFTFDYEKETNSILRVEGVRSAWDPKLVSVTVRTPPAFADYGVPADAPQLASAFYLEGVPYRWKRGIVERLP